MSPTSSWAVRAFPSREDLTLGNNDGETPLLLAAQEGHTELVELLLECGAEKVGERAVGLCRQLWGR